MSRVKKVLPKSIVKASRIAINSSDTVIGACTDLMLVYTFFALYSIGAKGSVEINRALADAQYTVDFDINYKSIKRALYQLTKLNLVTRSPKRTKLELQITKEGLKRIEEILPSYKTERPWDGFIYLVSYDIPSKANAKRNILRNYLKKIGCGLLQESLWLTPYNPKMIVEKYIDEFHIPGTILVSKLGSDGSIGDETLEELIKKVFKYDELNKKYEAFIDKYENVKQNRYFEAFLAYQKVLKIDPQLPFELEPENLKAKEAYKLSQEFFR